MALGSVLHQQLCQQDPFRGRQWDFDAAGGALGQNETIQTEAGGRERLNKKESEENRKASEKETRQRGQKGGGEARRDSGKGVEELVKLLLTAMGPLNNPGILSEINLSSWSCWACHYDVVLALSQWQFVQCFPSPPYYSVVQRSGPSIHLCLPVCLFVKTTELTEPYSPLIKVTGWWPRQKCSWRDFCYTSRFLTAAKKLFSWSAHKVSIKSNACFFFVLHK